MKDKISIRQLVFLFLFISITPIFSYIPNTAAIYAGNSGYISALYNGVLLCIFALILLQIIKAYPNCNLFDILKKIFGTIFAKIIVFLYGLWAFTSLTYRLQASTSLMQTTLMPTIHEKILVVFLFMLITYAIFKGKKTIFRFTEFLYGPLLFFLLIIFIIAVPSFHSSHLVPISPTDLKHNFNTLYTFASIGGNLIIILFFSTSISENESYHRIQKRVFASVGSFTLISFLTILMVLGISGPYLSAEFSYPIFQSVKSVSMLNTFERFDSFITMICSLSDFAAISIFVLVFIQCFSWIFDLEYFKSIGIIALIISCSFIVVLNSTQFEVESFYRHTMIPINLVFQYVVPVLLGIICIFKNLLTKNSSDKNNS